MKKLITIFFILMAFSGYSQFESTFSQVKILDSLKLVKDAAAGKVLTSDIYGVATWQDAAGGVDSSLLWTQYDMDTLLATSIDIEVDDFDTEGQWTYSDSVGIGVTTPTSKLDIDGDIQSTHNLYLQNDDPYNIFIGNGETKGTISGALNIGIGHHNMTGTSTTANNNVIIGHEAGTANTTGEHNMVMGNQSFRSNTTGGYNVAIGTDALAFNTTADDNVAVGHKALNKNITSWYNTAVGYRAFESSLGVGNTGVGNAVGNKTTTGFHNTAVGAWTIYENRVGIKNTIVGTRAGYNYLDSLAILVGYRAGQDWSGSGIMAIANGAVEDSTFIYGDAIHQIGIGTIVPTSKLDLVGDFQSTENVYIQNDDPFNIFIGSGEKKPTTLTNDFNIGIGAYGFGASSATTAQNNVFIGNYSGGAMIEGEKNTSIGHQSLGHNTNGDENTAIGQLSLSSNTTGSGNTAIGVLSSGANITSNNSTAIGYYALQLNIAPNNTAIGANTLVSNISGSGNTAVGYATLINNLSGANNTAIGTNAAHSLEDSLSVIIGYRALYDTVQGTHMALANGATRDSLWIYGDSIHDVIIPHNLTVEEDLDCNNKVSIATEDLTFGGVVIFDSVADIRELLKLQLQDTSETVYKVANSIVVNDADSLLYIYLGGWKKL